MSNPSSPKVTQQQIDAAMQNEQSLVKWLGTGGLEAVLTAMNQNIVYRGIMAFADTTSMALAGGADSQYAVCVNGVLGLNFYKYYPNIDASVSGAITSNEGGQWRPIFASQNTLSGVWKEGAANDDIIQRKAGVWVSRTVAQYITDLTSGLSALFAPHNGWILTSWASPTRTSATTFTVSQDVSALISRGYKLKFTDTTTKYLVVDSATWNSGTGKTTIVTYSTTDYSGGLVGNPSAIYYSNVEKPFGWPDWFNYTGTASASSGSITSYAVNEAKYSIKANQGFIIADVTITNKGTAGGDFQFSMPFTAVGVWIGSGRERALTGKQLWITGGGTTLSSAFYDNTSAINTNNQLRFSCFGQI